MSKIVLSAEDINSVASKFVKGLIFESGVVKFNGIEVCSLNMSTSLNYKDMNILISNIQINNDYLSVDFQVKKK